MTANTLKGPLLYLSFVAFACGFASAQSSTVPGTQAIATLPSAPPNPPIFSQMTAIVQGGLQYIDSVRMKGLVARVDRDESQTVDDNPHPFHHETILTFDESQRVKERIDKDLLVSSSTANVWKHGKLQSQTVTHYGPDGKTPEWQGWQKWSYDEHGRVSEFRTGRDKEQMTWLVNFKYDEQGRPLGYEDKAEWLLEISYSKNKVTLNKIRKYDRHRLFEQVQILDDKKRVIDLRVSDLRADQMKLWYHVSFKYDAKDRIIEQDTDPFKLGSGDDYSPLPGKVVFSYDDEKHSGEQKYYDPDNKLALHAVFEVDLDGILTSFHVLDASGGERPGSELFVDLNRHLTNRTGDVKWEVVYDDQGNWTERRRWFIPADGTPRIITRLVKQSITYR